MTRIVELQELRNRLSGLLSDIALSNPERALSELNKIISGIDRKLVVVGEGE